MLHLTRRYTLSGLAATTAMLAHPTVLRATSSELRVRRATDFQTFDPAFIRTLEDEIITASILAPLVTYLRNRDAWETRSYLANSVHTVNGARQLKVVLRNDENWKSHATTQPILADDIKFSFMRLRDNISLPNHHFMAELKGLTVTSSTDAQIVLAAADPEFPVTVLGRGQAAILPKSALAAHATADFGLSPPDQSGAYTIKELVPGDHITIERNPDWQGRKAKYDRVTFIVIRDDRTAQAYADRGDIDLMQVPRDLLMAGVQPSSSKLRLKTAPTGRMVYLTIFPSAEAMRAPAIRHGIQILLDPTALAESGYGNIGAIPATGFLPAGWRGRPSKSSIQPNLDEAGSLLKALSGRSLRIAVSPPFLRNAGTWIATTLKEFGIGSEEFVLEMSQLHELGLTQGQFDLLLTYAPLWRIGLQQTLARFSNVHAIHDTEIDELNAQAAEIPTPEILQKIATRLSELGAVRVLVEENDGWFARGDLTFPVRPDGFMDQLGNWSD
jgi:ABC-type transport system substrate-binding protein